MKTNCVLGIFFFSYYIWTCKTMRASVTPVPRINDFRARFLDSKYQQKHRECKLWNIRRLYRRPVCFLFDAFILFKLTRPSLSRAQNSTPVEFQSKVMKILCSKCEYCYVLWCYRNSNCLRSWGVCLWSCVCVSVCVCMCVPPLLICSRTNEEKKKKQK